MKYLILTFIKNFYVAQKIRPFESMIGFFCIFAGIITILDFGIIHTPITELFIAFIGAKLYLILNIVYILSGVGVFFGVGLRRGNIEAFGLATLVTTIVIRTILFGLLIGFNPLIFNTYVLNVGFIFACIVRLMTIIRNNKIIEIHGTDAKLLIL